MSESELLFLLAAPEEEEVLSSTSDPDEMEETELQAASQHLTQDFLCQVIQEEGQGKTADEGFCEQEAEPEKWGTHAQVTPLSVILGKLPSAARLGLQESFHTVDESEPGVKHNLEHKR